MGHDRLAPTILSRLHAKYRTPVIATIVMAGWSCLLVFAVGVLTQNRIPKIPLGFTDVDLNLPVGKDPFDVMTDFAIFGSVTFETMAVASIFVFRRRIPVTPENRPYRCWGYPVVPAIYIAIMAAVVFNFFASDEQRSEALVGSAFIAIGALVYASMFRERKS
jgi:amino acid transporter